MSRLCSLRVILASQSPARLGLLKQIGIEPSVIISDFEENLPKSLPPAQFVERTAEGKLGVIEERLTKDKSMEWDVVVAADTIIAFEGDIIGKPIDEDDARSTLNRLSGNTHEVYTGVALLFKDGSKAIFHERTKVVFRKLPSATIEGYIASREPFGRAGSYGIGLKGIVLVDRIEGCFSNIVGLPLSRLAEKLEEKGITM